MKTHVDLKSNIDELKNEIKQLELQIKILQQKYRDWETDRKSTRLNSSHRL